MTSCWRGRKTVLVCDVCGEPAKRSLTLHTANRRLVKDLCGQHLAELIKGARPVRRGRPRGAVSAPAAKSPRGRSVKKPSRAKRSGREEATAA
jgi:hypothetical protein